MENLNLHIKVTVFALLFTVIGFILPWWSIILIAALIGYIHTSLWEAMKVSFISCFLSWFVLTLIFDAISGFRISVRLDGMIHASFPIVASLIAAAVGGILCAFTSATVNQFTAARELARSRR